MGSRGAEPNQVVVWGTEVPQWVQGEKPRYKWGRNPSEAEEKYEISVQF